MSDATTIYITSTATEDAVTTETGTKSSNTDAASFTTSSSAHDATTIFITSTAAGGAIATPTEAESSSTESASLTTSSSASNGSITYTAGTGLSTGAKVGIGIGVALGTLLLLCVGSFLYVRRRKRRGLARGDGNNVSVLPELGTDGQKHELPAEESKRAELGVDERTNESPNLHELE
ncbi:hypothetical protein N7507_000473 [Penicillium longicatenatum]|nr:hypothetical protein N7507_000473 [Penicillium longicatenatum]